jgi:hypothetical protein
MPAQEAGAECANSIGADSEAGLARGVTEARHVNGEEREDESAELVEEGAEEKNPGSSRECPQVLSEAELSLVHDRSFLAAGKQGNKNPPAFQRVGFLNLGFLHQKDSAPQPLHRRHTWRLMWRQLATPT